MKKNVEEAYCSNCEWTGDTIGNPSCPVCGSNLAMLNAYDENAPVAGKPEKYPVDVLLGAKEAYGDDDIE